MGLTPDQAGAAVERRDCPKCAAPAGSACRTQGGRTAIKYHTARFILVPALKEDLEVAVPAARGPGKAWTPGQPPDAAAEVAGMPIRIGYARYSTAGQELASQLDALDCADCRRVFSEKISTRVKVRPELEKALALAHEIRQAAPGQPVILTVHELKRLARNAAELRHRRRHAHLRHRAEGQGRPRTQDREEAHHQGRQERREEPVAGLPVPGAR